MFGQNERLMGTGLAGGRAAARESLQRFRARAKKEAVAWREELRKEQVLGAWER